jgi:4-diphosphocytidyl-2C-methyl-D-erythritol kinase
VTSASAQAKINLYFQVGPLRSDGYHDVVSVYQALGLGERVTVAPANSWQVTVESDLPNLDSIPRDEENLVVKAAFALAKHVGFINPQPMSFHIEKNIPVAGGMAGGSADAAAALVALNEEWCLGLELSQLIEVGKTLGADVPFALIGGTALGTGTGTDLKPIELGVEKEVVLLVNELALSTKDVFNRFDSLGLGSANLEVPDFQQSNWLGMNSLTAAAFGLLPQLSDLAARDFGLGKAYLSGSGPTLWYLAADKDQAAQAVASISAAGYRAFATGFSSLGARLV